MHFYVQIYSTYKLIIIITTFCLEDLSSFANVFEYQIKLNVTKTFLNRFTPTLTTNTDFSRPTQNYYVFEAKLQFNIIDRNKNHMTEKTAVK